MFQADQYVVKHSNCVQIISLSTFRGAEGFLWCKQQFVMVFPDDFLIAYKVSHRVCFYLPSCSFLVLRPSSNVELLLTTNWVKVDISSQADSIKVALGIG